MCDISETVVTVLMCERDEWLQHWTQLTPSDAVSDCFFFPLGRRTLAIRVGRYFRIVIMDSPLSVWLAHCVLQTAVRKRLRLPEGIRYRLITGLICVWLIGWPDIIMQYLITGSILSFRARDRFLKDCWSCSLISRSFRPLSYSFPLSSLVSNSWEHIYSFKASLTTNTTTTSTIHFHDVISLDVICRMVMQ